MPEVVFVTDAFMAASQDIGAPIIGPPETTITLSDVVPPAISIHWAKEVPTGTFRTDGSLTSPVTVRYFSVKGIPLTASATAIMVATLSTMAPTSNGIPAGGTTLPVTS